MEDISLIEIETLEPRPFRTWLKFTRSDLNGSFIGFVAHTPGTKGARGVRADYPGFKKIVLVSSDISNNVVPNILYRCLLKPMKQVAHKVTGKPYVPGYIAVEIEPVEFEATVTTHYEYGKRYIVEVVFGNQHITFNPFKGSKEKVRSHSVCRDYLEKRCDIKNRAEVIRDFELAAANIIEILKRDMHEINNNKHNKKAKRRNCN